MDEDVQLTLLDTELRIGKIGDSARKGSGIDVTTSVSTICITQNSLFDNDSADASGVQLGKFKASLRSATGEEIKEAIHFDYICVVQVLHFTFLFLSWGIFSDRAPSAIDSLIPDSRPYDNDYDCSMIATSAFSYFPLVSPSTRFRNVDRYLVWY